MQTACLSNRASIYWFKPVVLGSFEITLLGLAKRLSKGRDVPIIISDDEEFIEKFKKLDYMYSIFTSREFILKGLPDYICFDRPICRI